ncbi:phage portal protein [Nocardioides sp.]|uniref:phage portal protein n=1 Tax=Nocardioides sp. TaxID=35761 RepID=UPI0035B1BBFF
MTAAPSSSERSVVSINDYIAAVSQYGFQPSVNSSMPHISAESLPTSYAGHASGGMYGNSVLFSCMAIRQLVFSSVRLRYQRLRDGKPSDMFGTPDLTLLEVPGAGETTQNLLSRMIQDADLAGNAYQVLDTPLTRLGGDDRSKNVLRLRPDWIEIVVRKRMRVDGQLGWERVGYVYTEGGKHSGNDPVPLLLDEVAHFAPIPDPLATFRGMSWLTPVAREIENDGLMNMHKRRFFENGATPNMIIKHPVGADRNKVLDFAKRLEAEHGGIDNAGKTLNLYPGADATVVGSNMEQLDFAAVQGAGETRIAAAAQVPPVLLGLTEAKYAEYPFARRRFADGTMHPLWMSAAGALGQIMPTQAGARLWYDADDIPFLREDEKDAAAITQIRAATLASLVQAGYTPESAAKFLMTADDFRVLEHTGLFSVQLQRPGANEPTPAGEVTT